MCVRVCVHLDTQEGNCFLPFFIPAFSHGFFWSLSFLADAQRTMRRAYTVPRGSNAQCLMYAFPKDGRVLSAWSPRSREGYWNNHKGAQRRPRALPREEGQPPPSHIPART